MGYPEKRWLHLRTRIIVGYDIGRVKWGGDNVLPNPECYDMTAVVLLAISISLHSGGNV